MEPKPLANRELCKNKFTVLTAKGMISNSKMTIALLAAGKNLFMVANKPVELSLGEALRDTRNDLILKAYDQQSLTISNNYCSIELAF